MDHSTVIEEPVDLPAISEAKRVARSKPQYWFNLTEADMTRVAELGDAPTLAFAVIRAAAWGPRETEWVRVSSRASRALDRGYRWWYAATSKLEVAGMLQVQRQKGRAPRYRLAGRLVDSGGAATQGSSGVALRSGPAASQA